jgi:hypothetical protein
LKNLREGHLPSRSGEPRLLTTKWAIVNDSGDGFCEGN